MSSLFCEFAISMLIHIVVAIRLWPISNMVLLILRLWAVFLLCLRIIFQPAFLVLSFNIGRKIFNSVLGLHMILVSLVPFHFHFLYTNMFTTTIRVRLCRMPDMFHFLHLFSLQLQHYVSLYYSFHSQHFVISQPFLCVLLWSENRYFSRFLKSML